MDVAHNAARYSNGDSAFSRYKTEKEAIERERGKHGNTTGAEGRLAAGEAGWRAAAEPDGQMPPAGTGEGAIA